MVESPPTSLRIGTGVLGMALLSPCYVVWGSFLPSLGLGLPI